MKAITTAISVLAETYLGVLLCPSFLEMIILALFTQGMVVVYVLLGTSKRFGRWLEKIMGEGSKDDE